MLAMAGDVDHVAELDRADSAALLTRKGIEELQPRMAEPGRRVTALEKALQAARTVAEKLVLERRWSEAEVASLTQEAARLRGQSTQIKSPHAFQAMEHEVDAAEGKKLHYENRILDLMEQEEAAAKKMMAAGEALEKGRSEAAVAMQELAGQCVKLEAAHRAAEAVRAEILERMTAGFRSKYERLRGSKQGVAIARVDRQACTSCGSNLTPQALMELKRRNTIPMCEGCSRLLHWTGP